jgi:hypothetical protein
VESLTKTLIKQSKEAKKWCNTLFNKDGYHSKNESNIDYFQLILWNLTQA